MLQPEEDASLAEAESAASFVRSMAVFFATTLLSLEIVMTLADATADAPAVLRERRDLPHRESHDAAAEAQLLGRLSQVPTNGADPDQGA